jgi:hypothetical protein
MSLTFNNPRQVLLSFNYNSLYLLLSTENEHNGSSNGKIFSLPWHDNIKCRLWRNAKRERETEGISAKHELERGFYHSLTSSDN